MSEGNMLALISKELFGLPQQVKKVVAESYLWLPLALQSPHNLSVAAKKLKA
jgi:hypothetical protein